MELAIISEMSNAGKLEFKNKKLTKAVDELGKCINGARIAYVAAAKILREIESKSLYAEDFIENEKPSFAAFCEIVLGINKTKAYNIIKSAEKMLISEEMLDNANRFFWTFTDSALTELNSVGETYEEIKEFCDAHGIVETTTVKDIQDIKREIKNAKNNKSETENTKDNKGETENAKDNKDEKDTESQKYIADKRDVLLNIVAHFYFDYHDSLVDLLEDDKVTFKDLKYIADMFYMPYEDEI